MLEVYVLVSRKKSMVIRLLAYLMLALTIGFLAFSCVGISAMLIFAVVTGGLFYYFQFASNKEFEYSYFDGECRFAKVMNKSRRKSLGIYSMDEVTQLAPAGDRCVYKYENDRSVKVLDYTSGVEGTSYYDMIINNSNGVTLIKFEPDEEYLNAVCMKYGQKVVRRPQA